MNGGLNVEICDTDLNCCNAGSLDSDRDDFNKGITGYCLQDHWLWSYQDPFDLNSVRVFMFILQTTSTFLTMWSRGGNCDRAMWTCSTATWSLAARRLCWRRVPLSSLSLTMVLMVGRETGSGRGQCSHFTNQSGGLQWSEIIMLLSQLSYAIKNKLKAPKAPTLGFWKKYPQWGVFLAFRWFFMA